ncbi:MAG: RsiV family protein, partial [Lachnospiraceae bacterium]|nr:RsiV family protein [Lachnospiraceae bacterium]
MKFNFIKGVVSFAALSLMVSLGAVGCGKDDDSSKTSEVTVSSSSETSTDEGTSSSATANTDTDDDADDIDDADDGDDDGDDGDDADDIDDTDDDDVHPINVKLEQHSLYNYSEKYDNELIDARFEEIFLDEEDMPELTASLEEFSKEGSAEARKLYKDGLKNAKENIKILDEDYYLASQLDISINMVRTDTEVLSFVSDVYEYWGGAHGGNLIKGHNFDSQTGEELKLTDIISDVDALPEIVENRLDDERENIDYLVDIKQYLKKYFKPKNLDMVEWVLTSEGVEFIFNQYEIATFADGVITVDISYDEEPDIFTDRYNNAPDDYAMDLDEGFSVKLDVDDDDDIDTIQAYTTKDVDDIMINKIHFNINGKEITKKISGYSANMQLIHKDDKTFLYIVMTGDNDYEMLYIYRVTDNNIQQVLKDGMYGFRTDYNTGDERPTDYLKDEYSSSFYPITDPDEFYLDGRFNILSTSGGYARFAMGSNGKPELLDEYYTLTSFRDREPFITVKKDIECKEA